MKLPWYLALVVLLAAGPLAYEAGKGLGKPPIEKRATNVAGGEGTAPDTPGARPTSASEPRRAPVGGFGAMMSQPDDPAAAGPRGPLGGSGTQIAEETPDQRAERHRRISDTITAAIGEVSPEKRAALLQLNDESVDTQRSQEVAFMAGKLSHDDYMAQQHQGIVVMLDELHQAVTDDEYRKLTGLQPGVDPYEFSRTGVGGADVPAPAPQNHEGDPNLPNPKSANR